MVEIYGKYIHTEARGEARNKTARKSSADYPGSIYDRGLVPLIVDRYSLSSRSFIISMAEYGIGVPGPKIQATPAL